MQSTVWHWYTLQVSSSLCVRWISSTASLKHICTKRLDACVWQCGGILVVVHVAATHHTWIHTVILFTHHTLLILLWAVFYLFPQIEDWLKSCHFKGNWSGFRQCVAGGCTFWFPEMLDGWSVDFITQMHTCRVLLNKEGLLPRLCDTSSINVCG